MIRRIISFKYSFVCYHEKETEVEECIGDKHNWQTQDYEFDLDQIESEFPQSLVIWRDIVSDNVKSLLEEEGEKNCQDTAEYLHLCHYNYDIISVTEEIIPEEIEIPYFVLRTIEDLERRKDEAKTIGIREAIQKTIDRLKKEYGISDVK